MGHEPVVPFESARLCFYTPGMEVRLDLELQSKLSRMAAARGSDVEVLGREAIERFVDYDEWFIREVETGLASADNGTLLTPEQVGARLERLLADKQSHS